MTRRRFVSALVVLALASCRGGESGDRSKRPVSGPSPVVHLETRGGVARIALVGDIGGDFSRVSSAIRSVHRAGSPLDAIIVLGDNFYDCGIESVDDPRWTTLASQFGSIGVPVYPILGNHDYGNPKERLGRLAFCGNPDPQAEIEKTGRIPGWTFPARSYRIESALVDLFLFDSSPIANGWRTSFLGSETSSEVEQRLRRDLEGRPRDRWRIVAGHHVLLSSGNPRSENERMRQLLPLLESEEVDLYIAGHDHHLELIEGSSETMPRPLFVISGAGTRLRKIRSSTEAETRTLFPATTETFLGFALLEIDRDTLNVRFYDAGGALRGGPFFLDRKGAKTMRRSSPP